MYNYSCYIDYEEETKLAIKFEKMLKNSGFNIVNFCDYFFKPQGYTALWLLSESHFAIHSFPEDSKIYIELTSCVEKPFEKMKKCLNNNFIAK